MGISVFLLVVAGLVDALAVAITRTLPTTLAGADTLALALALAPAFAPFLALAVHVYIYACTCAGTYKYMYIYNRLAPPYSDKHGVSAGLSDSVPS